MNNGAKYARIYFDIKDIEEYIKQHLEETYKDQFVRVIDVEWHKHDGTIDFECILSNDDISTNSATTSDYRQKIAFNDFMHTFK